MYQVLSLFGLPYVNETGRPARKSWTVKVLEKIRQGRINIDNKTGLFSLIEKSDQITKTPNLWLRKNKLEVSLKKLQEEMALKSATLLKENNNKIS